MTSNYRETELLSFAEGIRLSHHLLGMKVIQKDDQGVLVSGLAQRPDRPDLVILDVLKPRASRFRHAARAAIFHVVKPNNAAKFELPGHFKDDQILDFESLALSGDKKHGPFYAEHRLLMPGAGRRPHPTLQAYLLDVALPFSGFDCGRLVDPGWQPAPPEQIEEFGQRIDIIQHQASLDL